MLSSRVISTKWWSWIDQSQQLAYLLRCKWCFNKMMFIGKVQKHLINIKFLSNKYWHQPNWCKCFRPNNPPMGIRPIYLWYLHKLLGMAIIIPTWTFEISNIHDPHPKMIMNGFQCENHFGPLIILDHLCSPLVSTKVLKWFHISFLLISNIIKEKRLKYISHQIGQIGHVDVL